MLSVTTLLCGPHAGFCAFAIHNEQTAKRESINLFMA